MNRVALVGRLTRDPDVRYTDKQLCIARFSLATDKFVQGEKKADYVPCIAFGKTGETIEKYTAKGDRLAVEGRVQTTSYTGKDGKRIYQTNVLVERAELITDRDKAKAKEDKKSSDVSDGWEGFEVIEEELPF